LTREDIELTMLVKIMNPDDDEEELDQAENEWKKEKNEAIKKVLPDYLF